MSSNGSCGDKYELQFSEFLLKRLESAGGSLRLQHITGHLSQLSYDIRCAIGSSEADLVNFLNSHSHLFSLRNNIVRLADSSSKDGGYDSDCSSSIEQHMLLPLDIRMGKGVIINIFKEFGFIKMKEPVKSEVHFRARSFGGENVDLTKALYIGAMVYFNAKRRAFKEGKSKYFATKVWKVDESNHSNTVFQRPRKNHETGLYDPMVLESEGVIQNIFPNLGFIAVKGDDSNTVFFHKNRLRKFENIVDLTKVLSKGDLVEFTAHRSTKQDAKARWEATKVWKKSGKIKDDNFEELDSNVSLELKTNSKKENRVKEMLKNQRGKICPRSQGAVIKFGQDELADGDAAYYFIAGSRVTDISWEFSEGDDVIFDAVKIKSAPGWKAILVWVGEKPDFVLPTCLGDFSEFTDEETDDNFSNYVSNSSNSSTKSLSVKSGSSSSKMKKQDKLEKLSSTIYNKEVKKFNEENVLMKSCITRHDSSSQYGSQNSLSSSIASKSSQRSRKDKKKENSSFSKVFSSEKVASCWGDSPYFASENDQYISTHDNFEHHVVQAIAEQENNAQIKDFHCKSGYVSSDEEGIKENIEACELSYSPEESKNEKEMIPESERKKASIRKYKCLEGRIMKVYSKFAEVKASKLQNTVSFFWNNFYFGGVSVEEKDLEDLKQVLKVGDFIHFNYFEIVDDAGQSWQKVSLAWNGPKPIKADEMSPGDFIKQNGLSVSIRNEIIIDEEEKVVPRKFLAAFEDKDHNKLAEEVSKTESFSDDELPMTVDHSEALKEPSRALSPGDYNVMLNAVTQILRKNLFTSKSEVDLNSVSEEVINLILENHKEKNCNGEFNPEFSVCDKYVNVASQNICANCEKICDLFSPRDINTTNSETQTIITGEIIAQNIFTEC